MRLLGLHIDLAGEGARGRVGVEDDSAGGVAAVVYLQVNNNILNFLIFFLLKVYLTYYRPSVLW